MMRVALLALLLAAFVLSPGPALGDCPAPTLDTADRVVRIGDPIAVTGQHWISCSDTSSCWGGGEDPQPDEDILVMLKGSERFYELGRIDALVDGTLLLEAAAPDVPPGRYRLVVGESPLHGVRAEGFITVMRPGS